MRESFLLLRHSKKILALTIGVVAMLIIFVSCEPESNPASLEVKAGDTARLLVKVWDTVIGQDPIMNPWDSLYVDIDNDGTDDLLFNSYEGYWHGPTDAFTKLQCLSGNIEVAAILYSDTVFFRKIYSTTYYNDKLNYNETSLFTCERENPDDSIHAISQRGIIQLFANNQPVSASATWISDTLTLTTRDFTYGPRNTVETPDTIYNYIRRYKTDCHNLPGDSIIYIGFRKQTNGIVKYGWIKLSISNQHVIHLYETAIEK